MINKKRKLLFGLVAVTALFTVLSLSGFNFFADADNDGLMDSFDNCPLNQNPDQADFDSDREGDACDHDDDNDGVNDEVDAFDENPLEWSDFDFDNIGDNSDNDDDNDNIVDAIDAFDADPTEWADFDFDGVGANQDQDDDNDGILDVDDPTPVSVSEELTKEHLEEIESCASMDRGTPRLVCYSQFFNDLVKQLENNEDALTLALSLNRSGAVDDCHFISHAIGHAAFEENPNAYENLYGVDSEMCRGGFYHGIISSYFLDIRESGKQFPSSFESICDDFINTPSYDRCLHGLGHGLVTYYPNKLETIIDLCDQLPFYQNNLCLGGAMMEYSDEKLTRYGISEETMSSMCQKSQLNSNDYEKCNLTLGGTLAFHTNHNLEEGSKFCEMIDDKEGKEFCISGLDQEIKKAEYYLASPFQEVQLNKLQPKWIKPGDKKSVVEFRSLAIISGFNYFEETKAVQFSFNKPAIIKIYAWSELLPEKLVVTTNGVTEKNVSIQYSEGYRIIQFSPTTSGTVIISGLD